MYVRRVTSNSDSEEAYPCATEKPVRFWADGLPLSRDWFSQNLGKHVEAFHLKDDQGNVIGHVYWAPSERALAPYCIERGVAYVYCEWVQRDHQHEGGVQMLYDEFEDYLLRAGYKGILVEGTNIEEYMHYRHFAKRGFQVIRESETGKLMYLPLTQASIHVQPLQPHVTREGDVPVDVLVVGSKFCPVGASTVLALRKVVPEFGDEARLREAPQDAETVERYGVTDGIFVNGKALFYGPVEEETVRQAIRAELAARRKPASIPSVV